MTIAQTKLLVKSKIDKVTLKRLRPQYVTNSYRRKDGHYLGLFLPAFINVAVDNKFEITSNDITYNIRNSKVSITIWKDEIVAAQICIY